MSISEENPLDVEPSAVIARQAVALGYGEPTEVIDLITAELPSPQDDQVRVKVRAVGLNPVDATVVRGFMGTDESKLPLHPGYELAGTVEAIGDEVADFGVGDEVVVYPTTGALADHVIVDASRLRRRPAEVSPEIAAGLLLAGATAADTLATAGITAGDVVVVHGGAGAVGVVAVQLATRAGAAVIATASPRNHEYLKSLGAIPVAYGAGLADRIREVTPGPVTAAIDTVGSDEAIDVSLQLVPDHSRIVSIAAFGRADDGIVLVSGGGGQSLQHRLDAIDDLLAAAADGSLVIEVARTYPLDDAAQAIADLSARHPRGKLVVIP
ncbi:zinc-binding dehydrogenase [Gordonia desulfuricans]|uniref:Zinc-binding dehydrogenase n=1 Tax=Gordonia desulfuricans TaxID=89051 RepID=A0A7K3LMH8_9ACTN|nr:zinc-binding dehydrogenase [Gordonia desulfuricans]NDK89465.1 zinc-binding dehydrogenase [Gordonia desulfuricans]